MVVITEGVISYIDSELLSAVAGAVLADYFT